MFGVVSEVWRDIGALVTADLGPASGNAEGRFLDWLHYRTRLVPQRPRTVLLSDEVRALVDAFPAITEIETRLERGESISPWLSNSARRAPANPRADMMFNDWQLLHLHLGELLPGAVEAGRTGPLLFAYIEADHAVLLDVHPHSPRPWALTELLSVLLRTYAPAMARTEIKGVEGRERNLTDEELLTLRSKHSNGFIRVGDRFFMAPGMGVVGSGHALRLVRRQHAFLKMVQDAIRFCETDGLFETVIQHPLVSAAAPIRIGARYHVSGILSLVEKTRGLSLSEMRPLE